MDQSVEGILQKVAEDFALKIAGSAADLAKHRKSKTLETADLALHLGMLDGSCLFFRLFCR